MQKNRLIHPPVIPVKNSFEDALFFNRVFSRNENIEQIHYIISGINIQTNVAKTTFYRPCNWY